MRIIVVKGIGNVSNRHVFFSAQPKPYRLFTVSFSLPSVVDGILTLGALTGDLTQSDECVWHSHFGYDTTVVGPAWGTYVFTFAAGVPPPFLYGPFPAGTGGIHPTGWLPSDCVITPEMSLFVASGVGGVITSVVMQLEWIE